MRKKLTLLWNRFHRWPAPTFADLGSTEPVDRDFGYNRGTPIDRFYIDNFLTVQAARIHGRTLEVGDDAYTASFGAHRTTTRDVLHIDPDHPSATLRGDLTTPGLLPKDVFDCAVITQTLHLIYDMRAALTQLHTALRPGGALLITVPGVSQVARDEWRQSWCWSFTPYSLHRLLSETFGDAHLTVQGYGNVFAATAFLQGLCLEELPKAKLEVYDPQYPVLVSGVAVKAPEGTR